MILDEANLKLNFESIFANDPNFESESENTKAWAFRAFVAAHGDNLGIFFVKMMNERLFKHYENCEDFSFAPSFVFIYTIDHSIIKFGDVVVWNEDNDGMLCDEDVVDGIMEKVRKFLV